MSGKNKINKKRNQFLYKTCTPIYAKTCWHPHNYLRMRISINIYSTLYVILFFVQILWDSIRNHFILLRALQYLEGVNDTLACRQLPHPYGNLKKRLWNHIILYLYLYAYDVWVQFVFCIFPLISRLLIAIYIM